MMAFWRRLVARWRTLTGKGSADFTDRLERLRKVCAIPNNVLRDEGQASRRDRRHREVPS